ncbi:hypothetical protein [Streptomyces sp. V4I2]|uniref:hypothetical protein n=1 Tax=Streptomyces sp. V4I2 TaxID=3042280 RepID=UPI002783ACED|nr:hypothetical protein [Streptomyces sp. V4I2]MDQ1041767.1 hypothetical protein [Streptomyces sp. V4I2]
MSTRRNRYGAAADRTKKIPKAPDASTARVRTEPIRVTLDLKPRQHAELKRWCNGAAVDTGLPEVALAPVLRILGELLVENEELAEQVRAELIKRAQQL